MNDEILRDPLNHYLSSSIKGEKSWISENMKNYIPMSLSHSIALGRKHFEEKRHCRIDDDLKERLGKILELTTKKYYLFTEQANENLDLFYSGGMGIEVAHQPKFMGGERFVFNKLALGSSLANMDSKFYPIFYLADYDKVHGELTKTHFSLVNSSSGFSCSIDPEIEREFMDTSIREIPLPTRKYLDDLMQQIFDNYQFSINSCVTDAFHRKLLEERLEDALRLIKQSYYHSRTYNDWFVNITGMISNVFNDQGYLFIFSSDDDYRELLTPVYEQILKDRERYIEIYAEFRARFEQKGLKAPLRHIRKDFVPFFYECPGKKCNRTRIRLKAETTENMVILQGKCEKCGLDIEIITKKENPDLSGHSMYFTPRVETRQYLVAKTLQPAIHVSGTGETRYYTMSIPLLVKFDPEAILPVIHFYNKTTINTFITRCLEQDVLDLGILNYLDTLKELMKNLGKFNKLTKRILKKNEFEEIRTKAMELLENIKKYMNEMEPMLSNEISSRQDFLETSTLASYRANLFGTISKERHGQEAAFHWIDLALKNGLSHLFEDYQRIYAPWLPPGMEIFL